MGEKHQRVVASHVPPTRDLAHNPGMCPTLGIQLATTLVCRLALAQSSEPLQPGLGVFF